MDCKLRKTKSSLAHQPASSQIYAYSLMLLFLFPCLLWGQSTTSKKALKAFDKAEQAYYERDYKSAERHLEKALSYDSEFMEAWILMAETKMDQKQYDESMRIYENIMAKDSMFYPPAAVTLSRMYNEQSRFSEAVDLLEWFLSKKIGAKKLNESAMELLAVSKFRQYAVENPVPFHPNNMGTAINTDNDEYINVIEMSGNSILFTRRFVNEINKATDAYKEYLLTSERLDTVWQISEALQLNWPTTENMGAAVISADGREMYFSACGWGDGYGSCDLYVSYKISHEWSAPRNLGKLINTSHWESQPSISADGNELFFASNRNGNSDIYRCVRMYNGMWSRPERLNNNINTSGDEMAPFIHPDGRTMYFSSNKHVGMGGADLFMVRRDYNGVWAKPINLGYPINSSEDEINFLVAADGVTAYISSQREEGFGHYDIFSFELDQSIRPEAVTYINATVRDFNTDANLQAQANFYDPENGQMLYTFSTNSNGEFFAVLPSRKSYSLEVTSDGYLFYQEAVFPTENSELKPFDLFVNLKRLSVGNVVSLENIHFEFNSASLSNESKAGIDMLTMFLKQNPAVKVELAGHTDNVGDENYNRKLSLERANAVRSALINSGISSDRMTAKGYGSSKPLTDNDTDENRAKNRRTEMKITNM